MQKDLLTDYTVLDLSQRLPGPLAANIMRALGAKVIKVEPPGKLDAFVLFGKVNPLAQFWYDQINQHKEVKKIPIDFDHLQEELSDAQFVIVGKEHKIIEQIKQKIKRPYVIMEVCGSKDDQSSMHDINVLAKTQAIKIFLSHEKSQIINPPYLPFAGISFAQQIATEALASYLKALQTNQVVHTKVYIDETVEFVHDHFWDSKNHKLEESSLHNGRFPCYNFYQTSDGKYIALGAVEEKFWLKFIEIFKLPLNIDDRFDTSDKTFNIIKEKINTLTLSEIKKMTSSEDICLTSID